MLRTLPLLVALATASACRDKTPRPEPTPPTTESEAADGGAPPPALSLVRVGLLDSGATPRAPLRYRLSVGDRQVVVLRLTSSASNRLRAAAATNVVFPSIKLVFQLEIVEALRGDRVRYRFDLGEAALTEVGGADKRMVATATEALKQARGMRGSAVVDSRGIIRDGTIDIPTPVDASMQVMIDSVRSSMEQLTTPLPEEPVGVGARWELSQTLVQGGTALDQVTVYELVSVADGLIELKGTVEQTAERQDVGLAGFEFAELLALTASGETQAAINLTRIAPESASQSMASEARFEFAKKSERRQALISTAQTTIGVASQ